MIHSQQMLCALPWLYDVITIIYITFQPVKLILLMLQQRAGSPIDIVIYQYSHFLYTQINDLIIWYLKWQVLGRNEKKEGGEVILTRVGQPQTVIGLSYFKCTFHVCKLYPEQHQMEQVWAPRKWTHNHRDEAFAPFTMHLD